MVPQQTPADIEYNKPSARDPSSSGIISKPFVMPLGPNPFERPRPPENKPLPGSLLTPLPMPRKPGGNLGPNGQDGSPGKEGSPGKLIESNGKLIESIDSNKGEFKQNAETLRTSLDLVAEKTETSFKSLEDSMILIPESINNLPSQISKSISEAVFNHSITGNVKVEVNTEEIKSVMGEALYENWQNMLSDTTIRIAMAHAVQGFIKIRKSQIT